MKVDKNNENHIIAASGKVLQRKSDGWLAGEEIYLGYTYYLAGEKLDEPLLETMEDYREIAAPEPEEDETN